MNETNIYNQIWKSGWDQEIDPDDLLDIFQQKMSSSRAVAVTNLDVISETLMDELVANGLESYIILKHPEVSKWWTEVTRERTRVENARRLEQEKKRKEKEDKRKRADIISRLTPEERRLLGVK